MEFATAVSFIFFTVMVAAIAYYRTHRKANSVDIHTANGYFMAGGSLTCWVICGSMLLANLSGEQLIGLNGASYSTNLSAMAWEVSAGITAVVMSCYLLPRYLRGGFTTTPQFLEQRYDSVVKRMVSGVFSIAYVFIIIPATLYLGAIAFNRVFLIDQTLLIQNLTQQFAGSVADPKAAYNIAIFCLVWALGITASLYATLGGLKLAAVANSINALGLLIAGVIVLILGLDAVGKGSIINGMTLLTNVNPEKLSAIGDGTKGTVPLGGLFTGVMVGSMYYWATSQVIVQRCLAAKNLAEGQKGVLLTGFFKMIGPLIMMIPGVIAFHYYKSSPLAVGDLAYPSLVRDLLPWWMTGFFMAALFGTILSVANSLLGSATTLICMDFIKPLNPNMSDERLVAWGKLVTVLFTFIPMCIAPLLLFAPDGIFLFMRRFSGFFNVPVFAVFALGFLTRRVPPVAAKAAIIFNIITYGLLIFYFKIESKDSMLNIWLTQFLGGDVVIHFLYVIFTLFVFEVITMLLIGYFYPMKNQYVEKQMPYNPRFEEWRYVRSASAYIVAMFVFMYVTFSPLGIAGEGPIKSSYYLLVVLIFSAATVAAFFLLPKKQSQSSIVQIQE